MKTIDSTLQEMYYKQLAEAGSLLICCKQYSHNAVYLTPSDAGDFAVQITKPVSRLATAIFTMTPELTDTQMKNGQQYCNTFLGYAANEENFEAQLQLGSMRYPDATIQGYTQAYWRTLQSLGIANSSAHDIGVDFKSFSNDHFAVMLSTEKVDGVVSSGQNLQGVRNVGFQ